MKETTRLSEILIQRFERWTGLDLGRGSAHVALERYLSGRVSPGDPDALARYVDALVTPHHPEAVRLVDAITVCHSSFYRDPEQLAALAAVLRADLTRPASIWVPGCATGEDAYSIALVAETVGRRAAILATDINSRALAHATRGAYGSWSVRDLPAALALPRRADGLYEVPARLRQAISFARHNLMDPPPGSPGGWDVIVCRNVFMYFGRPRVEEVLRKLAASLRPGGYLFIGANDILDRPPPLMRFVRIEHRHVLWRSLDGATPVGGVVSSAEQDRSGLRRSGLGGGDRSGGGAEQDRSDVRRLDPGGRDRSGGAEQDRSGMRRLDPGGGDRISGDGRGGGDRGGGDRIGGGDRGSGQARSSAGDRSGVRADPGALLRAHALLEQGDGAGALELLLGLLVADPLHVEARLLVGIAYHLAGDAVQAANALRAALVLAPELWPAEMYLGFALAKLGDAAGSARALRRGATLAASTARLPLSPVVAAWLEAWRVDAIALARRTD